MTTPRKLRVAVLMGGTSNERPISLSTGKMILSALDPEKYEVAAIDTQDLLTGGPLQISGATGPAALRPPDSNPTLPSPSQGDVEVSAQADTGRNACSDEIYFVDDDTVDGNTVDGNAVDSNIIDGNIEDGHTADGDIVGGNTVDGKVGANLVAGNSGTSESTGNSEWTSARPDVVFIALHGKGGEDGTLQGMLEMMGLPYTGSGVLASALAMDKGMTKRLFRTAGIPVLNEVRVRRGESLETLAQRVSEELGGFPVFVKPNAEGSTFGCSPVERAEQLEPAVVKALQYDPMALIEPYVRGMEITLGVLGNAGEELQALPIVEIVPKSEYYDYESKYAEGGSEHIIPARLPEAVTKRAQAVAQQCHELLGCRGMSRTDMLVVGEQFWVLEVNTIPGMTPTSLLPQAAAEVGISFSDLLDRIIASAL
jgi:D-alanine-D-alanine ligase